MRFFSEYGLEIFDVKEYSIMIKNKYGLRKGYSDIDLTIKLYLEMLKDKEVGYLVDFKDRKYFIREDGNLQIIKGE